MPVLHIFLSYYDTSNHSVLNIFSVTFRIVPEKRRKFGFEFGFCEFWNVELPAVKSAYGV